MAEVAAKGKEADAVGAVWSVISTLRNRKNHDCTMYGVPPETVHAVISCAHVYATACRIERSIQGEPNVYVRRRSVA